MIIAILCTFLRNNEIFSTLNPTVQEKTGTGFSIK